MKLLGVLLLGCLVTVSGATKAEAADEASWADGIIARASFTSGVADREPVDSLSEIMNDQRMITFFTELRNMSGESVSHRWEYNGQVMADVPFQVGGPRWRVWSTKKLHEFWLGEWTVSVVAEDGSVLESKSFHYAAPDPCSNPRASTTQRRSDPPRTPLTRANRGSAGLSLSGRWG